MRIYYFGFRFAITKFNLMTPGREEGDGEETPDVAEGDNKFASLARRIYDGLGADANVTSIDNCTTRLRLTVKDTGKVDQAKIKATGVPGVKVIDDTNIQVIVGTEVQFVADEMQRLYNHQAPQHQSKKHLFLNQLLKKKNQFQRKKLNYIL